MNEEIAKAIQELVDVVRQSAADNEEALATANRVEDWLLSEGVEFIDEDEEETDRKIGFETR